MNVPTIDEIIACPTLPSLPAVAVQVLDLTSDPNVRIDVIARVVQNDQGLSSKVLRTVNSSFYGLPKPCPNIGRAMTYLGLSTVKSLALGFSLVDMSKFSDQGLDLVRFWRRSVYAAAAARRICVRIGGPDPDEAFLAALMQDIGMLAIHAAMGQEYAEIIEDAGGNHRKLPGAEREILGFSHADVGAELARRWRFPDVLVEPIGHHHDVRVEPSPNAEIIKAIVLANRIEPLVDNITPESLNSVCSVAAEFFALTTAETKQLIQSAVEDASDLASSLDVKIGTKPQNVAALLAQAEEANFQHQLGIQREAEQLRQSNETLAKQTVTDALTQVGNRQFFDQELNRCFNEAKTCGTTLGVIIADADKFKSLNDNHGHQAGDAVLVELAARMKAHAGAAGAVCRYGGEEFVIIAPGADRTQTARLAEGVRTVIAAAPFDMSSVQCQANELNVTVSLGVAVLDPETAPLFSQPKLIVQAADRALYAAKDSGRNCVRVFKPRPKPTVSNAA